jgi:Mrp family chromosome partitioning ATPase
MAKKEEVQQLIVNNDPKSTYSEAIRSIRTNLQFSSINRDLEVLLITSPEPGDGKSFTSANLAAAYAQDGKKVLIIDCD